MIPYIYDGIIIIVIAVSALTGAKRGLLRSLIGLVFTAAAFIGAAVITNSDICDTVYEKYLRDDTMVIITDAMENAKTEVRDKVAEKTKQAIDDAVSRHITPVDGGAFQKIVTEFIDEHREDIDRIVSSAANAASDMLGIDIGTILNDSVVSRHIDEAAKLYSSTAAAEINKDMPLGITVKPEQIEEIITDKKLLELFIDEVVGLDTTKTGFASTAEYIEERILRPVILRTMHTLLWIVSFIAIKLILGLIMNIILLIKEVPAVDALDSALGFVTGIAGGAALTVFIVLAAAALIHLTGGMTYINDDIIGKTHIFRILYDITGKILLTN